MSSIVKSILRPAYHKACKEAREKAVEDYLLQIRKQTERNVKINKILLIILVIILFYIIIH